ncbi:hypothetical protein EMIT0P12_80088 [Pseudomonas sp. IT-P12]
MLGWLFHIKIHIPTYPINVGAGLLAKAVYQMSSPPTETPPSRASPLPHHWPDCNGTTGA